MANLQNALQQKDVIQAMDIFHGTDSSSNDDNRSISRSNSPGQSRRNALAHVLLRESPTPSSSSSRAGEGPGTTASSAAWQNNFLSPANKVSLKVTKESKATTELERRLNKQVLKQVERAKPQTDLEKAIMRRHSKQSDPSAAQNLRSAQHQTAAPAVQPAWMQEIAEHKRAAKTGEMFGKKANGMFAVLKTRKQTAPLASNGTKTNDLFAEIRARKQNKKLNASGCTSTPSIATQQNLHTSVDKSAPASQPSPPSAPPPPPPPPPPLPSMAMMQSPSTPKAGPPPPPLPPTIPVQVPPKQKQLDPVRGSTGTTSGGAFNMFAEIRARKQGGLKPPSAHSNPVLAPPSAGIASGGASNMFAEIRARKQGGLKPPSAHSNPVLAPSKSTEGNGVHNMLAAIQGGFKLKPVDRTATAATKAAAVSAAKEAEPPDMFAEIRARKGKFAGVAATKRTLLPKTVVELSPKDALMEAIRLRADKVSQQTTLPEAPPAQASALSFSSNPLCDEIRESRLQQNDSKFKLKPSAVANTDAAGTGIAAAKACRAAKKEHVHQQRKDALKPAVGRIVDAGGAGQSVDQAAVLASSDRPMAPTVDSNGKEIPAWKQKIFQRKLDAEFAKVLAARKAKLEKDSRWDGIPAWKRAIIEQKEAAQALSTPAPVPVATPAVAPVDGQPVFGAFKLRPTRAPIVPCAVRNQPEPEPDPEPEPKCVAPVVIAPPKVNPLRDWQKKKEDERKAKEVENATNAAAKDEHQAEEARWKGVPVWKRGILEKKKRDNQAEIDALRAKEKLSEARWVGIPPWKRAIIEKKEAGI